MANNTLTLFLEGDIFLQQFTETLRHFQNLVNALTEEVAQGFEINWLIEDLHGGSALATIIGVAAEQEPIQRVVQAYTLVGQALQAQHPIPFSPIVSREAKAITKALGKNITEIRFITAETDTVIYDVFDEKRETLPNVSFGAVKGNVQALSSRGSLKFTLYDTVFDKPVTCFLKEGQEAKMRDIWGKEVTVTGRITRSLHDGQPKSIRDITSIEPASLSGNYKHARGVLRWTAQDEPAEVSIRRIRDVEG